MKIAFVVPSLANRAPVIVAKDVVNELVKKEGVECTVFYFDEEEELKFDCTTIKMESPLKMNYEGFDIVHSHMLRPDVFVSLRAKKFKSTRFVSTVHSYMDKDMKNRYGAFAAFFIERLWCFFLNRFDKVVCLSNDMKQYYSKRIKNNLLTYVYNGRSKVSDLPLSEAIPEDDKQKIEALKSKYRVIGAVSNVTKIKGYEQLLEALAINNKYALLVIGDGPEKENLMQLSEKLGVSDRCCFLGYRANAVDYFRYFDIYAITSYSEGFPLVLLEAASRGVPVICSDLPVFREIFSKDEVKYYKLNDINELSRVLDELSEEAVTFSANIKNKFEQNYTSEITADKYLALYKSLL